MQHAGVDERRENARPEMKKTKSFCFYTGLFGFTSIFFLVSTTICVWIFICSIKEATDSEYGVVFVLALLPCGCWSDWFIFVPLYGLEGRVFSCIHGRRRRHDNLLEEKYIPAFCGPTVSSLRSCRSRSTGAPRLRSYIAPHVYFPRKKKRISSGIIRTILRTCSISSTVMRPFFRSFCIAFQSGRASTWKRKHLCWACRVSEALFVRCSPADSTNNGCGGTVFAV